jgi:hypothetical protein
MKRFYIALFWAGVAFLSLAIDIGLWITKILNVFANIAIGALCVVAFILFFYHAKKDIVGK